MKRLIALGLLGVIAVPAMAIDITAAVRAANAATVTRIEGQPFNANDDYSVSALFDGGYTSNTRWLEGMKPSESSPIVIQYDIDENFWMGNRPLNVVVKSFTLYNTYIAADAKVRAPTVFALSASRDGAAWTTLYAVDSSSPVTDWATGTSDSAPKSHTFEIPANRQGAYLHYRFTITGNNGASGSTSALELVLEGDVTPCAVEGATPSVFADAAFWFRGATDLDGDGILDDGEFSNALRLGISGDGSHGCTVRGATTEARIQRVAVDEPYRSASVETDVIELCPPFENDNGTWKMQGGYVAPSGCTLAPTNVGPYSAVMRVSVDNPTTNDLMTVASFGYDYSRALGLQFMFKSSGGNHEKFRPYIAFGNGKNIDFSLSDSAGFRLTTNKWIDVAITLGGGKVTVYTCPAGGGLVVESHDIPANLGTATPSYNLHLGNDGYADSMAVMNRKGSCAMSGRIAQFAVWGRCLTTEEVCSAFGAPRPDLFLLGVPNGSSAEFAGGTSSAASAEGKDGCASMPRSLTAENPSVAISFNATSRDAGMAQVLRVSTANQTGAGRFSASLNGTAIGEADYAGIKTVPLFVPKDLVRPGANTLTLTRLSGGALDIDAVALGGSIGLGDNNGGYYDEFRRANRSGAYGVYEVFDTFCGNVADIPEGVYAPGSKFGSTAVYAFSNVTFRVHVDPAVTALRCGHRFTAKLRQTVQDDEMPVRITLDGATVWTGGLAKNVPRDCSFSVPELAAGDHLISCVNEGSTVGKSFMADYYSFQVLKPSTGTMIVFR